MVSLRGHHPYPPEREAILYPKPTLRIRMLDFVFPTKHMHCDGHTRRDFLRIGAVGALGLTLPTLLGGFLFWYR